MECGWRRSARASFVYAAVYAGGFFKAEKYKKALRSAVLFSGCPLYPRKRTCAVQPEMSALGQKRTSKRTALASQATPSTLTKRAELQASLMLLSPWYVAPL